VVDADGTLLSFLLLLLLDCNTVNAFPGVHRRHVEWIYLIEFVESVCWLVGNALKLALAFLISLSDPFERVNFDQI
jgi:hypothetical protein